MKAEAEALVAKGDALKDEIKTMNTEDKIYTDITAVALGSEYDHIDGLLAKKAKGNTFYQRELNNAYSLLAQASKDGATTEQIKKLRLMHTTSLLTSRNMIPTIIFMIWQRQ